MCSMKPPYRYGEIGWPLLPASTTADRWPAAAAAGRAEVNVSAREPFSAVRRDMSRSLVMRYLPDEGGTWRCMGALYMLMVPISQDNWSHLHRYPSLLWSLQGRG